MSNGVTHQLEIDHALDTRISSAFQNVKSFTQEGNELYSSQIEEDYYCKKFSLLYYVSLNKQAFEKWKTTYFIFLT